MNIQVLPPHDGRAKLHDAAKAIPMKYVHADGSITEPIKFGTEILPPDAARAKLWAEAPAQPTRYLFSDGSVHEAEGLYEMLGGSGDPEVAAMARWFAETDRVIITGTLPTTTAATLQYTTRRVRVGNIYMYRFFVQNATAGALIFPAGSYPIGTPEQFPELPGYEFSNQMGVAVEILNPNGYVTPGNAGAQIAPTGIVLTFPSNTTINAGAAFIFDVTRSQMGPWATS